MSWEEFKAMAEREPSLEGNWIYRMEQKFLPKDLEDPYPKFDLWLSETRLFTSYEEAIKFLQKSAIDTLYNSLLTQIAVGEPDHEHGLQVNQCKNDTEENRSRPDYFHGDKESQHHAASDNLCYQQKHKFIQGDTKHYPQTQTDQHGKERFQKQYLSQMFFLHAEDVEETEFFLPALHQETVRIKEKDQCKQSDDSRSQIHRVGDGTCSRQFLNSGI